jgi:hypothetical protein
MPAHDHMPEADDIAQRWPRFFNVIRLDNVLVILTMLSSVGVGLLVVGKLVQGVVDDIRAVHQEVVHETDMRMAADVTLAARIDNLQTAEAKDIAAISQALQNMRDDYRELLRISGGPNAPQRR